VGSRSNCEKAYIAGFLDGDGSLMLQLKKRKDGNKSRNRFMATICFYQDSRHEKPLYWIQRKLDIGYISKRSDGITELRINGYRQVERIIKEFLPFIKFKKKQAILLRESTHLLQKQKLSDRIIRKVVRNIITIQNENYQTRRKKTEEELLYQLGLTP
jgi:hypothetical protein